MPAAGSSGRAPVLLRTLLVQQGGRTGAAQRPKRMEQPGRNLPGCFFAAQERVEKTFFQAEKAPASPQAFEQRGHPQGKARFG